MSEKTVGLEKKSLNLVVVGHVDHGKSTVIGRLLHDTNSLPQGTIDKVKKIAKETGKPFEYAYLLDAFEEEQQQGITIDITQIQFHTQNREYVIIDAPGHVEFLKNMISGAAAAEAAFLIVDAQRGIEEQTKRHAYMLKLLGVQKIYAIFNKMDLVDYAQSRFEEVKKELQHFLNSLNIRVRDFIPISAFFGENILEKTEVLDWYAGQTLIDVLDSIESSVDLNKKPLRFPIQDVYKFDDRRIIAGRIESGHLSIGDEIQIFPEGRKTVVERIAYWQEKDAKEVVNSGESVGIIVRDEFFNHRGETITHAAYPPIVSNVFSANIFWLGKKVLEKKKRYKIKLATQEVYATVVKIEKVLDASTLEQFENAELANQNDVAEVVFLTEHPIVFDAFKDFDVTGRFVIIEDFDVCGGGTIAEKRTLEATQLKGTHLTDGQHVFSLHVFDEYLIGANGEIAVESFDKFYHLGDDFPTKGRSYSYPEDIDILLLNEHVVLNVREKKFSSCTALQEFQVSKYPIITSDGFLLKGTTQEHLVAFLEAYSFLENSQKITFYNHWLDFKTYRTPQFKENYRIN